MPIMMLLELNYSDIQTRGEKKNPYDKIVYQ